MLRRQYDAGADPLTVLQELLGLTHWLTRVKVAPGIANGTAASGSEGVRGTELADKLRVQALTRAWQVLLKGLDDARLAPDPLGAAELVLIRLAHQVFGISKVAGTPQ